MENFSASYGDFIKFDEKPNEDFFLVSKHLPIFAVADGVTQAHFLGGKYVYPTGAKEAAEIFCREVVGCLENEFTSSRGGLQSDVAIQGEGIDSANNTNSGLPRSLRLARNDNSAELFSEAFDLANQKIKELNIKYGIDKKLNYVEYDWFDTVGIAGFLEKNILHYGYVGDCGVVILDKDNNKKFQTGDLVAPAVERFKKEYEKDGTIPLHERTRIMHEMFRNNPDKKGYGSFSGEEGVKNYYEFGRQKLEAGDLVIFYTDGILNYLEDKDFINISREKSASRRKEKLDKLFLEKSKENPEKYGDDKTFISFVF